MQSWSAIRAGNRNMLIPQVKNMMSNKVKTHVNCHFSAFQFLILVVISLCLCLDEDQDDFFNDLRREKSIKENVFEHFKKRYDDRKKDREDTVERHRISRQDKNPFDFLPRMKFKPVKNTFIHHEVNDLRKMIKAKMHQKRNHYDKSYHEKKRQNDTLELDRSEKIEDPILKTIELYLNKIITEDIEDLKMKEGEKAKDDTELTNEAKREKLSRRGRQDSSFDSSSSSSTEDPIISFLSGNIANLDDYEKFQTSHYYDARKHKSKKQPEKSDKISLLSSDSEIIRRGKQDSEFSRDEKENDSDSESESHGYPRHQSRLPSLRASGGRNQFNPNFPSVSKLPREVKILLLQDLSFSIS